MFISRILLCSALLLLFPIFLFSQEKDLAYYQEKALQNNPVIAINNSQQQLLILQERAVRAQNSKPLIYFSNDVLLTPSLFTNSKLITFRNLYNPKALGYDAFLSNRTFFSGQLNVSQNLLSGRMVKANAKRNNVSIQSIDQSNLQFKKDLEKYVTEQYLAAYLAQLQTIYQDTIVSILKEGTRIAKQLQTYGLINSSDLLLFQLSLKEQENTKLLFQNQQLAALQQLHVTCNLIDSNSYKLKEPKISLTPLATKYQYETRYDLDSSASLLDVKLNNTRYTPQLTAYGTTGYMGSDINNLYRNIGFSAGLRLFVSIYDGKQRKNFINQVRIEQTNQKITKEYNAKQVEANLFSILQQMKATKNNIRWIEEKLRLHEQFLAILKNKIQIGSGTAMEYIQALQEYRTNYQNKAIVEVNLLTLTNQYNYINW